MIGSETDWGRSFMIRTILLGSCVSVQGIFVRQLENGKIMVRVGDRVYQGMPVVGMAAA
jgi:hypothetical protein